MLVNLYILHISSLDCLVLMNDATLQLLLCRISLLSLNVLNVQAPVIV